MPTSVIAEVAERRVIHSLPHRRTGIVLGVVNVRGELLVCVSLAQLLGVEHKPEESAPRERRQALRRLLVVRDRGMPKAAADLGAAVEVLPLEKIGPRLGRLVAGETWRKGG